MFVRWHNARLNSVRRAKSVFLCCCCFVYASLFGEVRERFRIRNGCIDIPLKYRVGNIILSLQKITLSTSFTMFLIASETK